MGSSQKSEISLQHSLLPLVTAGWREEERREEGKKWENQETEKNTVRQVSGVYWNLPGKYSKWVYLRRKRIANKLTSFQYLLCRVLLAHSVVS